MRTIVREFGALSWIGNDGRGRGYTFIIGGCAHR